MLSRHRHILLWCSAVVLFLVIAVTFWGGYQFWRIPGVIASNPQPSESHVPLQSTITVKFDRPFSIITLKPSISPPVAGSWKYEDQLFNTAFYRKAIFTPEKHWQANQDYKVTLEGISPALGSKLSGYEYNFHTEPIPNLVSTTIKAGDVIGICQPIGFTVDSDPASLVEFSVKLEPESAVSLTQSVDRKTFLATPKSCLAQAQEYTFSISRAIVLHQSNGQPDQKEPAVELSRIVFHTNDSPAFTNFTPKSNQLFTTDKALTFTFSKDMDRGSVEQNTKITPPLAGTWQWPSNSVAIFTADQPLQFDTTYTVTVPGGTRDQQQGYTSNDVSHSFKTIGHATITSLLPRNGAQEVSSSTTISAQFDQEVDHGSAQAAFQINPPVSGNFSWEGNKMNFSPNGLGKDSTYTVTIARGIRSVHGQESASSYSTTFTTEQSVTLLNIPLDLQDHPLSCEVASLKMALNYRGAQVTETDLLNLVGFDPTPHTDGVWGDPDIAFVGDINGRQNTTGYGVHWGPIAQAANHYRSASAFSGWSASKLANAIQASNPVVIWGTLNRGSLTTWQTPGGRTINAWVGEHVRTVIGFKGPVDNPQEFIINDPIEGRITWTTSQLLNNWSNYNYSGVVVY